MPKKMGANSKSEEAKARKIATETEKKVRETKEKEEQFWKEAELGGKTKASKKKEEEAEKKAETAARKAEAKRIAEMEEKELEKASVKKLEKKANRVAIPVQKVTEAELRKQKEEEEARILKKAEEVKKKKERLASEEEYEKIVLVTNTNRDDSIIEARSVEEALAKITVADNLPADRHPEKRLKASFKVGLIHYFISIFMKCSWNI